MPVKAIQSEVTGSTWKLLKSVGDRIEADEPIMILESMKMEIPVVAEVAGTLHQVCVQEGEAVSEGQTVAMIEV